jgi:hypothetical protein
MNHAKFFAAISAALGVAVSVTADGAATLNDWIAIAAAAVGALAVYQVPNKPATAATEGE